MTGKAVVLTGPRAGLGECPLPTATGDTANLKHPGGPEGPVQAGRNSAEARLHRRRVTYGAVVGLLTAAVAMGVGQLVSGLTVSQGAPWAVVGEAAINLAPPPVKNFAISAFGSNDKNVLVAGILVVLAIFAAFVGIAALRPLSYAFRGLALLAAVGLAAACPLPKANVGWPAPTVFGPLAGAVALSRLTRLA